VAAGFLLKTKTIYIAGDGALVRKKIFTSDQRQEERKLLRV